MAVSLSLTTIPKTTRTSKSVSSTVVATGSPEVISSISGILLGQAEQVTIQSTGVDTLSIIGTYNDPFNDTFTYVSKGSSDKIESPSTISGVSNVPPKKDLFKIGQDTSAKQTKTYSITVKHDLGQDTFQITHDIENEWEGIRSFMTNYYK
jgi:hypothetical protein